MLGARQRGAFAGGAAGYQEVDPGFELPAHQLAQSLLIKRLIFPKRSDESGAASCEHISLSPMEQNIFELKNAALARQPLRRLQCTTSESFAAARGVTQRDGVRGGIEP